MPDISPDDLKLLDRIANAVKRKLPAHVDVEDLIQYGWFGLNDAREKFDPERGIKFETYATPRIRGAMLDALRDLDWAPRLARSRGDIIPAITSLNRSRSTGDWRVEKGNSREDAWDLPDRRPPSEPTIEDRDAFDRCLAFLHGDMKKVILLNFRQDKNLREIGEILDLSESRISQIRARALRILRANIAGRPSSRPLKRGPRRYGKVVLICDQLPGRMFSMKEAMAEAGVSKTSIHLAISRNGRTGQKRLKFRRIDPEAIPA